LTTPIVLFLAFGVCFGLLSYPKRHLFSEGPSRKNGDVDSLRGRLLWSLICSCLWPLMALTGLYSAWRLLQRAKARPDTTKAE
jgi:hypothetical protein